MLCKDQDRTSLIMKVNVKIVTLQRGLRMINQLQDSK